VTAPSAGPHAGDVAATFCATLVDTWVGLGLRHVVVAPGSRSTPLALAVAANDHLQVHVHHDERSAGFMALGIGASTGVPAVVVTTSGTAAVEVHPAVVEAHEAGVPMVVCTADRPPWLHGVGAPQTVDQVALYGASVRLFVNPGVPDMATSDSWRVLAHQAVQAAVGSPPGPVHLNLAFDEPLVGVAGALPPGAPDAFVKPPAGEFGAGQPDPVVVADLARRWHHRRGIIVAGGGIADPDGVMALASLLDWPVLADPRSGCRVPGPTTVAHADALLRHEGFAGAARPDVVVRLGSLPASKVLGAWLDGLDADQVGVDTYGRTYDPGRSLGQVVTAEPGALCAAVADTLARAGNNDADDGGPGGSSAWLTRWVDADHVADAVLATHLGIDVDISEPAVARTVAAVLPAGATLVVSSSMPVRDLEWYSAPRPALRVMANRGANGIDGVISTAIGVALSGPDPVVVLIGDVAALHDSNALLGLAGRDVNLTVVIVNNDGGGIFSFLPQAGVVQPDVFEQLYGTPHGVDLVSLARSHGVTAVTVDDMTALVSAITAATGERGATVVVARTDRHDNVAVHTRLHDAIAAGLA